MSTAPSAPNDYVLNATRAGAIVRRDTITIRSWYTLKHMKKKYPYLKKEVDSLQRGQKDILISASVLAEIARNRGLSFDLDAVQRYVPPEHQEYFTQSKNEQPYNEKESEKQSQDIPYNESHSDEMKDYLRNQVLDLQEERDEFIDKYHDSIEDRRKDAERLISQKAKAEMLFLKLAQRSKELVPELSIEPIKSPEGEIIDVDVVREAVQIQNTQKSPRNEFWGVLIVSAIAILTIIGLWAYFYFK